MLFPDEGGGSQQESKMTSGTDMMRDAIAGLTRRCASENHCICWQSRSWRKTRMVFIPLRRPRSISRINSRLGRDQRSPLPHSNWSSIWERKCFRLTTVVAPYQAFAFCPAPCVSPHCASARADRDQHCCSSESGKQFFSLFALRLFIAWLPDLSRGSSAGPSQDSCRKNRVGIIRKR